MHDVAVALFELDAFEGDAELRTEHLRKWRRMTLAIVERAGDQSDRAVILQQDLAALAALLLALGKTLVIGNLERLVEDTLEIAAVVGDAGRRFEGHLRRLDEIALAQLQPGDAHLVGGTMHQPRHDE